MIKLPEYVERYLKYFIFENDLPERFNKPLDCFSKGEIIDLFTYAVHTDIDKIKENK